MKQPMIALFVAGLLSGHVLANGPDSKRPGWSGEISLNGFAIHQRSQFNTHDENAVTEDLNNSGKTTDDTEIAPLGRLQYTLPSGQTQFFIGQSQDQVAEGQLQAELGVTQVFPALGELTLAYFPKLPGLNETWEDPFLTGVARQTTDVTTHGGRLAFTASAIPLTLRYGFVDYQLDGEDLSGQSLMLSDAQRQQLQRESRFRQGSAELLMPVNRVLSLVPRLIYTERNADGAANDFTALGYQLGINLNYHRHGFYTTFQYSDEDYDGINPVFGKKRDTTRLNATLVYVYQGLLGNENLGLNVLGGLEKSNSDIKFYETDSHFISAGISYRF
ncbi:DUF2860 family protein [Photobacterium galatheae]|uniref:DUF2860 domain-containing protein n=1 Tax=Photobacterium galatheae TaxID=1654360 RepID=A0A066RLJ5_9GAMM|nr:DUF2860 family protein [Photobacterium galatheae]KDM90006.1 hypothetical protein EA58_18865 [Photobacterium galatheae]MCM0149987.1 DUF2860 domain-containing protein [Photobacterium galatheae]